MNFNMTALVPYLVILAAILFVQRTFSNICDMYQMQNFIYFQKIKTCPHKILMLGAVIDDFLSRISNLHKSPQSFKGENTLRNHQCSGVRTVQLMLSVLHGTWSILNASRPISSASALLIMMLYMLEVVASEASQDTSISRRRGNGSSSALESFT